MKEDFKRLLTGIYETEIPPERREAKESNPADWVAHFIAARVVTNQELITWMWEWANEYPTNE
jgi:predicted transcriptional regulator